MPQNAQKAQKIQKAKKAQKALKDQNVQKPQKNLTGHKNPGTTHPTFYVPFYVGKVYTSNANLILVFLIVVVV